MIFKGFFFGMGKEGSKQGNNFGKEKKKEQGKTQVWKTNMEQPLHTIAKAFQELEKEVERGGEVWQVWQILCMLAF